MLRPSIRAAIGAHAFLSLSMGLVVTAGCGKGTDDSEDKKPAATKSRGISTAPADVPPDAIHLSFAEDPGFRVPLSAMEKFDSLNRLLPAEHRSAATWKAMALTMADDKVVVIESPSKEYGEAGYDLRDAEPGLKLVVFDKQTQVIKASFGPLAKIHITLVKEARGGPPPLPFVVDGNPLAVQSERLPALRSATEPMKKKPAWTVPVLLADLAPGCELVRLLASNAEDSVAVEPTRADATYLRFNRKGHWMFSVVDAAALGEGVLLRDVTRIEVSCKSAHKPQRD